MPVALFLPYKGPRSSSQDAMQKWHDRIVPTEDKVCNSLETYARFITRTHPNLSTCQSNLGGMLLRQSSRPRELSKFDKLLIYVIVSLIIDDFSLFF